MEKKMIVLPSGKCDIREETEYIWKKLWDYYGHEEMHR